MVAIKRIMAGFVRGDTAILDETRIWVKLQHPNIVSVIDFGEEDGDWFVALELVEGVTASDLVKQFGALPVDEALTIIERVARALHYAHTLEENGEPLNLVHRDVKPANILLSIRGEVKLTDFGIARAANRQSHTAVGILKGSLSTLSPEQVREEPLDPRSDLFALGATLFHLLAGAPMFDLSLERLLLALENDEIPAPPSHLPPKVRQLISALTAADKTRRPASAADVAKAIRLILAPAGPDDVEPALAKRVRLAVEQTPRPADRVSNVSSSKPAVPAESAFDSTSDRPTRPSQDRVNNDTGEEGSRTQRGAHADPTGDRETVRPDRPAPSRPGLASERATRPSQARANDTDLDRPTRPSSPRRDDEKTSDDLGARLPKGDDLDAPRPSKPVAIEPTEVRPKEPAPSRPASPAGAPPPRPRQERSSRPSAPSPPAVVKLSPAIPPENSFELPLIESPPRRERTITGRFLEAVRPRRPSMKALGVFAIAITVIAFIAVPEVMSRMSRARCDSGPRKLFEEFATVGALATANHAAELEAQCPPSPELRRVRQRALAFAGDTKAVRALLPPAEGRDPQERWVAAALAFTEQDFRQAESLANAVTKSLPAGQGTASACLAAAAAINQDSPERADGYLAKVNGDCVRILKAATAAQRGENGSALAILKTRPSGTEMLSAHESALGTLHLQLNDQDASNADAASATSEARQDALAGHPFLWYSTHSPRGGAMVLRVTGPMDDPILYATILAGDAARSRGNLDYAFKLYDEAAGRGGRTAIAEVRIATILAQQGKPQLARGRLTRALSIDPTFAPALVQLAILEEKGDPARAAEHAAEALKLQPDNRDARRIANR